MQYILLAENDPIVLSDHVSEMLNNGWELYGNPFVAATNKEAWFHYQALTKKEPT